MTSDGDTILFKQADCVAFMVSASAMDWKKQRPGGLLISGLANDRYIAFIIA